MLRALAAGMALGLALSLGLAQGAFAAPRSPQPAPAPPAQDTGPAQGPVIHQGRLPNGLRYAVVSSPATRGAVSVRLGIDVGSYDEADDERGLAHFVEHMAFNGSRSFAEDALPGIFARMGAGFGRDHNAYTSQESTTFHLDLPDVGRPQLDAAFQWLRDVADGLTFDPAAVEREKGVMLAEGEARSDAGDGWRAAMSEFTWAELRSTRRDPSGVTQTTLAATPDRLRAFYRRWYRPEHAVVVAVGDLPAEILEQKIAQAFRDWNPAGPAGVRAPRQGPARDRGEDVLVLADPQAPLAASICRLRPPMPPEPAEAAYRQATLGDLWRSVLGERLKALTDLAEPAVLEARTYVAGTEDASGDCVEFTPAQGRLDEALAQVGAVIRRFQSDGPDEAELEAAIEEARAGFRGGVADDVTEGAADRADRLMYDLLDRRALLSGREAMRRFDRAVAALAPQDLRAAFLADWSGWGPLIRITTPEPGGAPGAAAVRAAWSRPPSAAVPLGPAVTLKAPDWPYADFGRPGRVVKREQVADPGFTRLTFSNGVVLNFRASHAERHQVLVRVRFGAGRSGMAPQDYQAALWGARFLREGGLGRLSLRQLEAATRGAAWSADLTIGDHAFALDGETYASGLGLQLGVLAAYLWDPGFRPTLDARIPVAVADDAREAEAAPDTIMDEALIRSISPDSPQLRLSPERAAALRAADYARILKPALTGAPLTVTVVGDVTEAEVVDGMTRTLAALPPRGAAAPERADTPFLRFPAAAPAEPIRATHAGARDKAIVGLYWPTFTLTAQTRREAAALDLLGAVMEDRLLARVRESLGKSYSPEAGLEAVERSDQGYLWASVESTPRDLPAVEAEALAVARRLQAGEIDPADLEAARRPRLAHMEADAALNSWWLTALNLSDRPDELATWTSARALVAAVTLDDVRQAAAAWLKAPPIVVEVTPGPPADGGGRRP